LASTQQATTLLDAIHAANFIVVSPGDRMVDVRATLTVHPSSCKFMAITRVPARRTLATRRAFAMQRVDFDPSRRLPGLLQSNRASRIPSGVTWWSLIMRSVPHFQACSARLPSSWRRLAHVRDATKRAAKRVNPSRQRS
jgi:hypothetical protein